MRTGLSIGDYRALTGKKVGAVEGSTTLSNVIQVAPEAVIVPFVKVTAARAALLAGERDAITSGAFILMGLRQGEARLSFASGRFSTEAYGIAMKQGQSELRDAVNAALMDMWDSGQWRAIYDAWFGPDTAYQSEIRFAIPVVPR